MVEVISELWDPEPCEPVPEVPLRPLPPFPLLLVLPFPLLLLLPFPLDDDPLDEMGTEGASGSEVEPIPVVWMGSDGTSPPVVD